MTTLISEVVILFTRKIEIPFVFFTGGLIYMLLEICWRGSTHWSMGICGGLCFCGIYVFEILSPETHIFFKCLFGSIFITFNEFITGCIVNILLGWNVWDYSEMIFNVYGQICMIYSILWFALSFPAFKLSRLIRNRMFSEKKILHSAD